MRPSPNPRRSPPLRHLVLLGVVGVLILSALGVTWGGSHSPVPPPARTAPVPSFSPVARPGVHLHPGVVYPAYAGGFSEPAPMGVTDFGVTSAGAPYEYSTRSWLGSVSIGSLKTTSGGTSPNGIMSFQLNVVLFFKAGSGNFSYWVQNVVVIDTSTETIGFENNIWNFSSASPKLASGEITGNGTTNYLSSVGYWYAYGDSFSGSGNGIRLHLPTTVQAMVTTSFDSGVPRVDFLYNDGVGWVSYDNVSFNHATGWTDLGFTVDGYDYAPIGPGFIFSDAEWDFVGMHSNYKDVLSNLSMELQYWNGHNFQEPPNAFNFGGDTGESMYNVVPGRSVDAGGTLNATEVNGSTGSLGTLYSTSQVATLRASVPNHANGTLRIGSRAIPFTNYAAIVTISPGTYPVSLWESGTEVGIVSNVTLTAGNTTRIELPFWTTYYPVAYHSMGLPAGTNWSVSLGPNVNTTSGAWLNFSLVNGSYPSVVAPVAGYSLVEYRSTLPVQGLGVVVELTWAVFTFTAALSANGLGAGTPWTVAFLGGPTVHGAGAGPFQLQLANGTYPFTVSTVAWYSPAVPASNLTVAGADANVTLSFSEALASIVGLLEPANASLTVNGVPLTEVAANGTFQLLGLSPGVYAFVASAPGYETLWKNLSATPGNSTAAVFELVPLSVSDHPGTGPSGGTNGSGGGSPFGLTYAYLAIGAIAVVALVGLYLGLRRTPGRPN